ncbi:hypothetical protein MNBD_NITROSPINAE04-578 [hydrothermal vent metagenome]|uniref:Lipoprotein SmpA/OmlA domain-containing protein n=1 Tax=hydrothermal vent metagenome TaxID=652676 RepID=A0A3B1CEA6_9ZZZZ
MNSYRSVFTAIVMAGALAACASNSLQIDEPYAITKEKVALLKEGEATKEDVTRMFGGPEMVTPVKGGKVYFYKSLSLNSLWVTFKSDGTVKKLKWSD